MATIPEVPQEQKIVPEGPSRRVNIPTFSGGSVTPQATYTSSYIAGQTNLNTVENLTSTVNKVVDQYTIADNEQQGYAEQQTAIAEGNAQYLSPGVKFTTAGQAYQKGARIAYISNEIMEVDTKIKEYENAAGYDAEKFLQKTNDYKKELLGKYSSDIQVAMSEKIDSIIRIRAGNLVDRKVKFDVAKQAEAMDSYDAYELNNFRAAYLENGPGAIGVEDALKQLATSQEKRYEAGQSIEKILSSQTNIKQELANIIALKGLEDLNNPKSPNYNPGASEKYITDYSLGKNNFGELGDTFSAFFKDGALSSKQRTGIVTALKQYDEELKRQAVAKREDTKSTIDTNVKDIEKGISYKQNAEGFWEYKSVEAPIAQLQAERFSNQEIQKIQQQYRDADIMGRYAFNAKITNPANQGKLLANLNADRLTIQQNTTLDEAQKNKALAVISQAEASVTKILESKQKALVDGKQAEWLIENLKVEFDYTSKEGYDKFADMVSKTFNVPFSEVKPPKTSSYLEYQILENRTDGDQVLAGIGEAKERLGPYWKTILATGAKNAPSGEKNLSMSVLAVANVAEVDGPAARQFAFDYKNRKNLIDAYTKKYPADGQKTNKDDAEKKFNTEFGRFIDTTTDEGKIIYDAFMLKFYSAHNSFVGQDQTSNKQAIDQAVKFVKNYYPTITFSNGTSAIVPASETNTDDLTNRANDVLQNPTRYGIILGKNETLSDWDADKNRIRFVYDNGQLVLRTNNGMNLTRIYMRLPSDGNSIIASDMKFGLGNKYNGLTQDAEITTTYDSNSGWYDTFNTNRKTVKPVKTFDEFNNEEINYTEKSIDDWATDLNAYGTTTLPKTYAGGAPSDMQQPNKDIPSRYVYQDRFVRNLAPEYNNKQTQTFNLISLALKDGKIDNLMLQWMADNSAYLRPLLQGQEQKDTIIQYWKENHKELLKSKTAGSVATQMSVLQSFTATLKDLEPTLKTTIEAPEGP